jgi:hypothetical protein
MKASHALSALSWSIAALAAVACSGGDERASHEGERLKNGETPKCDDLTKERLDGIGMLFYGWWSACTATLIGPRAILTAAHCFDFTTAAPEEAAGKAHFEIDPHDHCGRRRSFEVRRWQSFSATAADGTTIDLAVAMLDQSIPASGGVRYFSLAAAHPNAGTHVTLHGRGGSGDAWQDVNWAHSLRRADVAYDYGPPTADWRDRDVRAPGAGSAFHLMHGDSGGPVLSPQDEIILVNSALETWDGEAVELFADVVQLNRRTALGVVASAFAAGIDWPGPVGSNGWPCADGELAFCDADYPAYLRKCDGPADLFAAKRRFCPAGCANGACLPHGCENVDECGDGCILHLGCTADGVAVCVPNTLTDEEACAAVSDQQFGDAPSSNGNPGGNPMSGGSCCAGDNLCANPPSTPGCPMTAPGGYCDPNGDGSFTDADWGKGWQDYQAACTGSPQPNDPPPPDDPPPAGCPCTGDNRCANPPGTPGCPMTAPGGYCDPNGDGSFTDGDWVKGWSDHAAQCV